MARCLEDRVDSAPITIVPMRLSVQQRSGMDHYFTVKQ